MKYLLILTLFFCGCTDTLIDKGIVVNVTAEEFAKNTWCACDVRFKTIGQNWFPEYDRHLKCPCSTNVGDTINICW